MNHSRKEEKVINGGAETRSKHKAAQGNTEQARRIKLLFRKRLK